jgi:dethiobiotin synthetase/adenosylmethionine--8-amino-7-oxononanoate aminotransferase
VLFQLWDDKMVLKISSHSAVERVVVLGTLFALELKAEGDNAGYYSFMTIVPFSFFLLIFGT